jgi:hypothetical protein
MNFNQVQQFRQRLIEACDKHIAAGGKIVSGTFKRRPNEVCPLTCLSLTDKDWVSFGGELWAFIIAFDDSRLTDKDKSYVGAVLLGKELRQKYLTK